MGIERVVDLFRCYLLGPLLRIGDGCDKSQRYRQYRGRSEIPSCGIAKDAHEYDFIHVHTKMPDEAGHTKNPWYKKDVIEAIDRAMSVAVNEIIPDREVLLVVTADHSTASSGSMIHTGETVPITMVGKYVRRDEVGHFNEIACAKGVSQCSEGKGIDAYGP